jgi:aminoglycoside 6'-N-acetyltransferase
MREDDLALMATWLAEEHVQRWGRDPSAPQHVEEKYLPRLRGAEPTEMFVILHADEPIGFIQRYLMRNHPDGARTLYSTGQVFDEAAGIDYAIGRSDLVGRGIGSAVVAAFSESLFESVLGAPDVEASRPHGGSIARDRAG